MAKLTKKTTLSMFQNNYWYATDLKAFAKEIGVTQVSRLRKDELEKIIETFLKTGKVVSLKVNSKKNSKFNVKDIDRGLKIGMKIVNYTSNKETKSFILKEALKIDPNLPEKSGCKYWLNRWREEKLSKGVSITYGDLIKQYVKLRRTKAKHPQIPSTKFNNFVSDFLAANEGTKKQALKEWEQLKKAKLPKNYKSWKKSKN